MSDNEIKKVIGVVVLIDLNFETKNEKTNGYQTGFKLFKFVSIETVHQGI